MSIAPKSPKDLALAPVAAEIDANLQRLRDRSPDAIDYELQLELNGPARIDTRATRAQRVLSLALRDVELHGWHAEITDDGAAVRLSGGSVSLDISLGTAVHDFIEALVAV